MTVHRLPSFYDYHLLSEHGEIYSGYTDYISGGLTLPPACGGHGGDSGFCWL